MQLLKNVLSGEINIWRWIRIMYGQNRYPAGHYYSPVPDIKQIKNEEHRIWGEIPKVVNGVDLNIKGQLHLLDEFSNFYGELPFNDGKQPHARYCYINKYYSYGDAISLYSMIRYLKPERIIEVGSGYSSGVILDTNEIFLENKISCTFIDPYPKRLLSIIKEEDKAGIELIQRDLQVVDIEIFKRLKANDILFIDSTHVSKIGSDVNYIFFKILPTLNPGVYIHFHDISYPFEYPKEVVYKGIAWNEAYILRAFLQYNRDFQIVFFNSFLASVYGERFMKKMPLVMKNAGGSIWIKKIG